MTDPGLFPDVVAPSVGDTFPQTRDAEAEVTDRSAKIRRSALWAAYGDALGWISELTNPAGLRRRAGGAPLCRPIEWTRRIGGRAGITTLLPQGCYSDDSQLRLATGRAIGPNGFDVEAFAKVELPIWLSYELGGGKSTSAAAANLAKPKATWFANTFKGWVNSGGNGAAMRIQPHVWAARTPDNAGSFLPDVIRNAVCTHSHPIGILGAVLHALTLARTMVTGLCLSADDLLAATDVAADLPEIMRHDTEIGSYWRVAFERESGAFSEAWMRAIDECKDAIRIASGNTSSQSGADRYADIVDRLKLRDPARRGSGMLTAVAAVGLIWCETRPEEALRIAANAIGTDTDTIATMAGAILGATAETEPPVEVLDVDLFRSEADRLADIARGGRPKGHRYPDLLRWSAPRARADTLIYSKDGSLYVRGLGRAEALSEPMLSSGQDFMWQWVRLEAGQTLLIKRRKDLMSDVEESETLSALRSSGSALKTSGDSNKLNLNAQQTGDIRAPSVAAPRIPSEKLSQPLDLQRALDYIAEHKDDDKSIGVALRRVVNKGTTGQIAAFTSALIDYIRQSEKTQRSPRS
jgi:ADP-ribosylglycohydrolase